MPIVGVLEDDRLVCTKPDTNKTGNWSKLIKNIKKIEDTGREGEKRLFWK